MKSKDRFNPKDFPHFRPSGSASPENLLQLTRHSISTLIPTLVRLSTLREETNARLLPIVDLREPNSGYSDALAKAFAREGSDKGTHGYHRLYAQIMSVLQPQKILEIGIGYAGIPESVSRPGRGLRAFQSVFPEISVVGADINPDALGEQSFPTLLLDQLNLETFPASEALGQIDLVIDDGLHMPTANINTLIWALCYSPTIPCLVVEDVPSSVLPVWQVAAALVYPERRCVAFRGELEFAIVVADPSMISAIFAGASLHRN